MDPLPNAGGPRFCRWSSLGLIITNTCRKRRPDSALTHIKLALKIQKVILLNVFNPNPVRVNGEDLPTTEEFTYLGSTVRHDWRNREWNQEPSQQCQRRLQNAQQRVEVLSGQQQNQAQDLSKLCDVHPTLWLWMLEDDREEYTMLSVFDTKNLFWPDTISHQQLLARCSQDSMETIIMRRR